MAEPREAAPGAIAAIHTAVPGRARLRVAGLRGNDPLKRRIEALVPDGVEIHAASASAITGNVLVLFDPRLGIAAVVDRLAAILAGSAEPGNETQHGAMWHAKPAEEVLRAFDTALAGLTSGAARQRLASAGANRLPRMARRTPIAMLADQLRSGPVLVLIAAATLSAASGGILDAAVILGVVALNAGIGFATESRTEAIIGTLRLPIQRRAPVRRDGLIQDVPVDEIVPGDLMVLRAGIVAAADARIVEADALSVDESLLTGESLPVAKTAPPVSADCPLTQRISMIYRGTIVTGGSGAAVAVATGGRTEAGRIQILVGEARTPETPLQRQLGTLGRQLVAGCTIVCGLVFVAGLLRGNGFREMLKRAIALGVAAVPEGLPTLATTALAIGIEDMRQHQVLVRRLDAVETLAAVNVIAFDKTGTLTRNEMSAAAIICDGKRVSVADDRIFRDDSAGGRNGEAEIERLLQIGALCSEAEIGEDLQISGSPTEAALVRVAIGDGVDVRGLRRAWPLDTIVYRSDQRQYIRTTHVDAAGNRLVAVKGSPEQVLTLCGWRQRKGSRLRLSQTARRAIVRENRRMAGEGLRVLGLAYGEAPPAADRAADSEPALSWIGLIGLADTARQGVAALLSRLSGAGVRAVMLTGDQARTASAVARGLGLAADASLSVVDAAALRSAGVGAIIELVDRSQVFARIAPADKLRIVQALQAAGQVVAMTGDGVNDSPAIRAADVGIVMGRGGADAARDVADIVLQADDLSVIAKALESGRTTYGNVRKAIHYLLATNLSEILVMLATAGLGATPPLSAIQLLWINLLSDVFPALGLAFEPPEGDVLEQPPRNPREPLLTAQQSRVLAREGAIIAAGSLAAYGYGWLRYGASVRARTIVFSSLVGAQLLHALTCRSAARGLFTSGELPPNPRLALGLTVSAGMQIGILTVPVLRRLMGLSPLSPLDVAIGLAGAILPFLVNEAAKLPSRPAENGLR